MALILELVELVEPLLVRFWLLDELFFGNLSSLFYPL